MYLLYPRLPLAIAEKLALERSVQPIANLVALSDIKHESATFSPIGGNKTDENFLRGIQKEIRACAKLFGYPNSLGEDSFRNFDVACARLLYDCFSLHPSEASHIEMWAFITCVLVPDVVRWRFPGEWTSLERYIGSDRGLRRNTFGRLWWRAFLLKQPSEQEPYVLLDKLVEDDLVQVTERNSIAASKNFLIIFCTAFIEALQQYTVPRRLLMRESSKRVRRLFSLICFDALDAPQLKRIMDEVFANTVKSLTSYTE